jgi:formamidopyrimidine-DNA glycosylase
MKSCSACGKSKKVSEGQVSKEKESAKRAGGIKMSIELPEAKILAEQMNEELRDKYIKNYCLRDCERLQRIGFLNRDIKSFDQVVNRKVDSVISRGNAILLKLDGKLNIILSPEYGGEIFYHSHESTFPDQFHLRIDLSDKSALTVRLTSMGGIHVFRDDELLDSYMFKRDFNPKILSPTDEGFTFSEFSKLLLKNSRALKSVLVGKDAILVGISNSAFQDIVYRAKLHPKRKASELNLDEQKALYNAVKFVLQERIRLNGKTEFLDLYQKHGSYVPAMGPKMRKQNCPKCRTPIEELSLGGGKVFVCPNCQV